MSQMQINGPCRGVHFKLSQILRFLIGKKTIEALRLMWKNNWKAGFSHNGQRWVKLVCCETNDKSIMESNYYFTFRNDMFQISNCTNMTDHRRFFVFGHRYKINHSLSVAPTPRGRVGSSPGPPSPQGASFGQANVVAFGPEISQTRLPWPSELRRILEYTFGMSWRPTVRRRSRDTGSLASGRMLAAEALYNTWICYITHLGVI